MLQYFRIKNELQVTKSIVSFETMEGNRLDISKKFIKKDPTTGQWYFTKKVWSFKKDSEIDIVVFIEPGKVFIAECNDKMPYGESSIGLNPVMIVRDIINFEEIEDYVGVPYAKKTYRS